HVTRLRKEIGHCAVAERQADLKPHVPRYRALVLERTEDRIRIHRVARIAEPPSRIAEPNLVDAGLDPECELVVASARLPPFDAVLIRGRPLDGFELGMPVIDPIGETIDPVAALTNFTVRHVGEPLTEWGSDVAKRLFGGLYRNASDQQQLPRHECPLFSEGPVARMERSEIVASCGLLRPGYKHLLETFALRGELRQQRRRLVLRITGLAGEGLQSVAHVRESDGVGVVHRPATPDRKPIAVDPDHIDVAGALRDPFLENTCAFGDHREQQALDDVFCFEPMPPDAKLLRRCDDQLFDLLIRFGRARARLVQIKTTAGFLAEAAKLTQLIGDRRLIALRLAHAPAD